MDNDIGKDLMTRTKGRRKRRERKKRRKRMEGVA
jgi:hypothetical protein